MTKTAWDTIHKACQEAERNTAKYVEECAALRDSYLSAMYDVINTGLRGAVSESKAPEGTFLLDFQSRPDIVEEIDPDDPALENQIHHLFGRIKPDIAASCLLFMAEKDSSHYRGDETVPKYVETASTSGGYRVTWGPNLFEVRYEYWIPF